MTWFDRQVDRLLLRLMPTFSRLLWWLPELIVVPLSAAVAFVMAVPVLCSPGVVMVALAIRRVVQDRRANRLARAETDLVDNDYTADDHTPAENTDMSGVSP